MIIAVGSDHGGFELKRQLLEWLEGWDYSIENVGCNGLDSVDYPDYALKVAQAVATGRCVLGILVCGTGIGMAIAANKVTGIRAASISDVYSARMFREHNDGNILCLGARVVGSGLAQEIVTTFLEASFAGSRHQRRVDKIMALESINMPK